MSKQYFGIAGLLQPSSKIYYESIFSQFQIGRMNDIFCVIAFENGANVPHFRIALQALISEACKLQAMLDTSVPVFEPVTIEYSPDQDRSVLGVSFTCDDKYLDLLNAIPNGPINPTKYSDFVHRLSEVCAFSTQVTFKIHAESRRAEIICAIPNGESAEQDQPKSAVIECIRFDEEKDEASIHEYVSMGDVDYAVNESAVGNRSESNENAKKIIETATSEQAAIESQTSYEIDQLIAEGSTHEEVIEALSRSLSGEQMAEIIKRNLTSEQVVDLISKTDPDKIADILTSQLSEEEFNHLVIESLSDEMKAKALNQNDPDAIAEILKKSLSKEEIKEVIKSGTSEQEKAKILAAADPKKTAKMLQETMTREEISTLLCDELPEEAKSEILADGMSEKQISEFVKKSLPAAERAKALAQSNPEAFAEMLKDALPEEELAEILKSNFSKEEMAKALVKGLSAEETAKLIKASGKEKDLGKLIRGHTSKEELAQLVKDGLSDEDLAQLVKGSMSEEEFSQLVKGSADQDDLKRIVKGGMSPQEVLETIFSGSSQEEAARMVKGAMSEEQLNEILVSASPSIPKETLVMAATQAMDSEQLKAFAAQNMQDKDFAQVIAGGLSPDQINQITRFSMDDPELSKTLIKALPPEAIAQSLASTFSPEKLGQTMIAHIPENEVAELISSGLSREEMAKIFTSNLPEEDYASILAEGMPAQEIARILSEGLPEDQFLKLLTEALSKEQIYSALASSGLTIENTVLPTFDPPPQQFLENAQMNTLLQPGLSSSEASSVLSTILPKNSVDSVMSGMIPKEDFIRALRAHLPHPEMAAAIADKVFNLGATKGAPAIPINNKLGAKPSIAADAKPTKKEALAKDRSLEKKEGIPEKPPQIEEETAAPPTALINAERFKEAVDTRVAASKRAVEFYLARAKALETQLRAAEDEKRRSRQEADKARLQLEKLLSESDSSWLKASAEKAETAAKNNPTSEAAAFETNVSSAPLSAEESKKVLGAAQEETTKKTTVKSPQAPVEDPLIKRQKEALRFFQEKAKTFEAELRNAEKELKLLQAEKKAELLKLAKNSEPKTHEAAAKSEVSLGHSSEISKAHVSAAEVPDKIFSGDVAIPRDNEAQTVSGGETAPIESQRISASPDKSKANEVPVQEDQKKRTQPDSAENPEDAAQDSAAIKPVQILQGKVRELETKLRNAEAEKQKWMQQYKQELHKSSKTTQDEGEDKEKATPSTTEENPKEAQASEPALASVQAKNADKTNIAASTSDEPVEVAEAIEKGADQLEQGLDGIVKRIEKIKDDLPNDKAKRAVDGIMGEVLKEKAKFYEKSRELSAEMRKKEFKFKNKEASLHEELRQAKVLADQKQAASDRMKQLMVEMQNKITKEQASHNQAGNSETQFRLKLEQSQRQVELLTKEIEKHTRRAQQPVQNQATTTANQQADFQKQATIANKALLAKKQEIEILKKQIAEKDLKEAEQKRALLKLQNEINAARVAASGRKSG